MGDHPIRLTIDDDLRRSRLTVLFRLLLALPHIVWLGLWSVAAVVASVVAWLAALALGRVPPALHQFLAAYLRYGTHVSAYLCLTANPFPGFTGQPGYQVDVEIPGPRVQARRKTALRLPLALPALLLGAALGSGVGDPGFRGEWWAWGSVGGVTATTALLGWFAVLARGSMPRGLRDLGGYGIGYGAQTGAFLLLLTDAYPNADPDGIGPDWRRAPHPVDLDLADDGRRSRLTVLFRLPLALPHVVWLGLWGIAAFLAAFGNGLFALARGRSADRLHRFLAAYVRYSAHVTAFLFLVANPFPGFTGGPGYPVDISIAPPERQRRWITLFRSLLVLPALLVAGALTGVLAVVSLLGWFASLVTGRMPTGLRNLGAFSVRYLSQVNAYWLVLTDSYPHASPGLQRPSEART